MGKANDGGRAFPAHTEAATYGLGMSLRDWLAGQALAGIIACHTGSNEVPKQDETAEAAYIYADAMLAERAKGGDRGQG